MRLKELVLKDFRNCQKREFDFNEQVTVLLGPNAVGKTNVLEAIRLVSTGDSLRAGRIEEMIRFEQEWGRVEAKVVDKDEDEVELAVMLTRGELKGKRVNKRRYLVNDNGKRKRDFVGRLPSVVFIPQDLNMIAGSPYKRRKWLDEMLSQVENGYGRSLQSYKKALRRRNKILQAIREGEASRYQLTFWDGLLIKHGRVLLEKREELVKYISEIFRRSELFSELRLEYDKNVVSERRLDQYEKEEVAAGHTLVGPHKDDVVVLFDDGKRRDLGVYGSRGEQRMAILGMKMGELLYLEEKLGKKPILLLDDIFSELDKKHSGEVHRVMEDRQVVVTTTEKKKVEELKAKNVIKLR